MTASTQLLPVTVRVQRGAAWLAAHDYAVTEIDIDRFDICDGVDDALGQTMTRFSGLRVIATETGYGEFSRDMDEWLISHGFDAPEQDDAGTEDEWGYSDEESALQRAWLEHLSMVQSWPMPEEIWPDNR